MDRDYLKEAIESVNFLLRDLLAKEDYCKCRQIGRVLEGLVEFRNSTKPECRVDVCPPLNQKTSGIGY